MKDTQLIDRLRSTYAAVAEQTPDDLVAPVGAVVPVEPIRVRRQGRRLLGAAAAVLLVLVGAAVVIGRDDAPAVGSIEALAGRLRHATLGWAPEGFGLVSIQTTDERDLLVFTDGERELQIVGERGVEAVAGDVPVRGRLGTLSSDAERMELRWLERPDFAITVVGSGAWTEDELVDVADDIVTVSDEAWEVLVQGSGFQTLPGAFDQAIYDTSMPAIAANDAFDRKIWGSLQGGVFVLVGSLGTRAAPEEGSASFSGDGDTSLIMAPASVASVEIVLDDQVLAVVRPIADPGMPSMKVASIRLAGDGIRDRAVARFLAADGSVISTSVLR